LKVKNNGGMIMRSNFRRSKVSIFRSSKEQSGDQKLHFSGGQKFKETFDLLTKIVSRKFDQEIESLNNALKTSDLLIILVTNKFFRGSKLKNTF
jgi:hypothetical protein